MKEERFYDPINKRLIYIGSHPSDDFWDTHWAKQDFYSVLENQHNSLVVKESKRFIQQGAKILEGGCGIGQNVNALKKCGYDAFGIDFAPKTVALANDYAPDLKILEGDVRDLPFEDNSFDAYWSLGVIEHFYDGYKKIQSEMNRVIKPGGFLFLTVPSMSLLRRIKAKLDYYPIWEEDDTLKSNFYQFAIDVENIKIDFEKNGFVLLKHKPIDGFKGFKDEVFFMRKTLQKIYSSNLILFKILRRASGVLLSPFSNHISLYIFKRINN